MQGMNQENSSAFEIQTNHNLHSLEAADSKQFSGLESALLASITKPLRLVPPFAWVEHIPFAFFLVKALKPELLVELGVHTANSFSAFCQAVGNAPSACKCFGVDTWEGDPHATYYDKNIFSEVSEFIKANFGNFASLIRSRFDQALDSFSDGSIDLLHIDGFHTYEAVSQDFFSWLPKMSNQGVVLLHDTNVRRDNFGVWKLFEELSEKYPVFEFYHGNGLGVVWVGKNSAKIWCNQSAESQQCVRQVFADLGKNISDGLEQDSNHQAILEQFKLLSSDFNWYSQFTFADRGVYREDLTQRLQFKGSNLSLRFKIPLDDRAENARLWLVNFAHTARIHSCNLEVSKGASINLDIYHAGKKIELNTDFDVEDLAEGVTIHIPTIMNQEKYESRELVIEASLVKVGSSVRLERIEKESQENSNAYKEQKARNRILKDEIQILATKVQFQESENNQLKENLVKLELACQECEKLKAENLSFQGQLGQILNSKSWKITAPLRACTAKLSKKI